MRLGDDKPEAEPEELPLEIQLWLNRGWTVLPTERLGIVLVGKKEMRARTKFLIVLGVVLLCLFKFGGIWPGLGAAFLIVALVDYKFGTKAPTKFFPGDGEKTRTLER